MIYVKTERPVYTWFGWDGFCVDIWDNSDHGYPLLEWEMEDSSIGVEGHWFLSHNLPSEFSDHTTLYLPKNWILT